MTEKFYSCELITDVVFSRSLATVGNLTTLDYIPGSNFLGIVASKIYNDSLDKGEAFDIFHGEKVLFGDAHISENAEMCFAMPFSFCKDKKGGDKIWNHHLLTDDKRKELRLDGIQLRQEKGGFFTKQKIFKHLEKSFTLRSAQDRDTRRSKETMMFGYESLKKGQIFIFSIKYSDNNLIEIIEEALIGNKRIGKSKNAEFGQICIKSLDSLNEPKKVTSIGSEEFTIVYAHSNLCFFNECGQSTFQPTTGNLGIKGGTINWEKSQIKTYSYSPWNFKRDATSTQRDCILKGSVFYVEGGKLLEKDFVGEYVAEGLGRVIYNPDFLMQVDENEEFNWIKSNVNIANEIESTDTKAIDSVEKDECKGVSPIFKFLQNKQNQKFAELKISEKVKEIMQIPEYNGFFKISSSQWGGIRQVAEQSIDIDTLTNRLFNIDEGILMQGVASKKYWDLDDGKTRNTFKKIIEANQDLGNKFVIKLATEIAKKAQK